MPSFDPPSMVSVRSTNGHGRCLIATRDIPAGTVLLEEDPWVLVAASRKAKDDGRGGGGGSKERGSRPLSPFPGSSRCHYCLAEGCSSVRLLACPGCGVVQYCSKLCQSRDWGIHEKRSDRANDSTVRDSIDQAVLRSEEGHARCEPQPLLHRVVLGNHRDECRAIRNLRQRLRRDKMEGDCGDVSDIATPVVRLACRFVWRLRRTRRLLDGCDEQHDSDAHMKTSALESRWASDLESHWLQHPLASAWHQSMTRRREHQRGDVVGHEARGEAKILEAKQREDERPSDAAIRRGLSQSTISDLVRKVRLLLDCGPLELRREAAATEERGDGDILCTLCKMACNAFSVCDAEMNALALPTDRSDDAGAVLGLYLMAASCINHSCIPTAVAMFSFCDDDNKIGSIDQSENYGGLDCSFVCDASDISRSHQLAAGSSRGSASRSMGVCSHRHRRLFIRSLVPLHAGDEVTISYVDPRQPKTRRRSQLREGYAFDCTCNRCGIGGDASSVRKTTSDLIISRPPPESPTALLHAMALSASAAAAAVSNRSTVPVSHVPTSSIHRNGHEEQQQPEHHHVNANWKYQDPAGALHGPFSTSSMRAWVTQGWFPPSTPVIAANVSAENSSIGTASNRDCSGCNDIPSRHGEDSKFVPIASISELWDQNVPLCAVPPLASLSLVDAMTAAGVAAAEDAKVARAVAATWKAAAYSVAAETYSEMAIESSLCAQNFSVSEKRRIEYPNVEKACEGTARDKHLPSEPILTGFACARGTPFEVTNVGKGGHTDCIEERGLTEDCWDFFFRSKGRVVSCPGMCRHVASVDTTDNAKARTRAMDACRNDDGVEVECHDAKWICDECGCERNIHTTLQVVKKADWIFRHGRCPKKTRYRPSTVATAFSIIMSVSSQLDTCEEDEESEICDREEAEEAHALEIASWLYGFTLHYGHYKARECDERLLHLLLRRVGHQDHSTLKVSTNNDRDNRHWGGVTWVSTLGPALRCTAAVEFALGSMRSPECSARVEDRRKSSHASEYTGGGRSPLIGLAYYMAGKILWWLCTEIESTSTGQEAESQRHVGRDWARRLLPNAELRGLSPMSPPSIHLLLSKAVSNFKGAIQHLLVSHGRNHQLVVDLASQLDEAQAALSRLSK